MQMRSLRNIQGSFWDLESNPKFFECPMRLLDPSLPIQPVLPTLLLPSDPKLLLPYVLQNGPNHFPPQGLCTCLSLPESHLPLFPLSSHC